MTLAIQAPFGAGPLSQVPQRRHAAAAAALLPLLLSHSNHLPFSRKKRGSHSTALPMQDTEGLSLCVPGAKGKKKKKLKPLGANSCSFVRLASSHKATKAVILEVKYYELPKSLEPKSPHHLISRKSLLQHLRMSP